MIPDYSPDGIIFTFEEYQAVALCSFFTAYSEKIIIILDHVNHMDAKIEKFSSIKLIECLNRQNWLIGLVSSSSDIFSNSPIKLELSKLSEIHSPVFQFENQELFYFYHFPKS